MKNITLLISLFFGVHALVNAQDKGNQSFTDTHWILTNLNEKVINENDEGLESFIIFGADNTFKGFSGCNKFQGTYKIESGKLTCEKVGATKMECEKDNNEQEFLKSLTKVVSFRIVKNQLMLKDKSKTILSFESK